MATVDHMGSGWLGSHGWHYRLQPEPNIRQQRLDIILISASLNFIFGLCRIPELPGIYDHTVATTDHLLIKFIIQVTFMKETAYEDNNILKISIISAILPSHMCFNPSL